VKQSLARIPTHRYALIGALAAALLGAGCTALSGSQTDTQTARATVGAQTPFTTLEAEAGQLADGAQLHAFAPPIPKVSTLELEASGDAYVRLDQAGASVSWQNPVAELNAIVIRSSIPDTPEGGGQTATLGLYVDGVFRQALTVSSTQSWIYRTPGKGWLDDPRPGGMPFHFYNEDRARIVGPPIARGSTLTLRKDAASTCPVYNVDCIDLEHVGDPLPQPADSLSVLDYGADPSGAKDSQAAIQACVDAARPQAKVVWIPAGRYTIDSLVPTGLDLAGVSVQGAGMWHTLLYRQTPNPWPQGVKRWRSETRVGTHSVLRDLAIDSNSVTRGAFVAGGSASGITAGGEGWLIQRVWVQHCDAQWLSGTNGTIRDCRVADSWADGINLNNSNMRRFNQAGVLMTAGINLSAINNFVRGGGDDGLATYSDGGEDGKNTKMVGTRIIGNTSVAPYWANALRVAGGIDVEVRDNLCLGSASNSGMAIGVFGTSGNPLESALVAHNVVIGGGGWNTVNQHGVTIGSHRSIPSKIVFRDNTIKDSRRAGIWVGGLQELTCEHNRIIQPATSGILIGPRVTGTGVFSGNTVTGLHAGEQPLVTMSPDSFVLTRHDLPVTELRGDAAGATKGTRKGGCAYRLELKGPWNDGWAKPGPGLAAIWHEELPAPGTYRVEIWYAADPNQDHATDARLTVHTVIGGKISFINLRQNTEQWHELGTYGFDKTAEVELVGTGADGNLVPVHVRFSPAVR